MLTKDWKGQSRSFNMNTITNALKNAAELVVSLAVMLVLAVVALAAGEYTMLVLFALALMVPVTSSFAVATWRDMRSLSRQFHTTRMAS
jgi:hypothetical protein